MVYNSEFNTQAGWYDSDQFTIEFSENGDVKIINKDAQNNCESTFEFDEQNNQINYPKNCAKFILELVDDQTLILYNQGREGIYSTSLPDVEINRWQPKLFNLHCS